VHEQAAIRARAWVRWLGFQAVFFGTIALLSAATESLWHPLKCEAALAFLFEFCGLFAAAISVGGLWLGPWRKRWLENRFMAERLRQWHFQLLIRKGNEIEILLSHSTPQAQETFRSQRKIWLDEFLHDHMGKVGSRMDALVNDPDFSCDWLLSAATGFPRDSKILDRVFAAYRRLRLDHQYDHATHMLAESTGRPFWQFLRWPLLLQESAFRGGESFCFIAALLCSVGIIVDRSFQIVPGAISGLVTAALVFAILGIALRTIRDGLGIIRDIERYRDYRGKVRRTLLAFEETDDQHKKLCLMEEFELVVTDELRGFLRTHRDAAFVL
jgi:hypothetical protein